MTKRTSESLCLRYTRDNSNGNAETPLALTDSLSALETSAVSLSPLATNTAEESSFNPFWVPGPNNSPEDPPSSPFWLSRFNGTAKVLSPPLLSSPTRGSFEVYSTKTPTKSIRRWIPHDTVPGTPLIKRRTSAGAIEEQYNSSPLESPGSPLLRTTGSDAEEQIPTVTQKDSIITQKIKLVLGCIKDQGLSLPVFLEMLFESGDGDVKMRTHKFYEQDGPSRIVEIWSSKLHRRKDWDSSFVNSAVDIVVHRTNRDLKRYKGVVGDNSSDPAYRLPFNRVTERNIEQVLSNGFLDTYAGDAQFLMRLLDGVLDKNKGKDEGKGKGKSKGKGKVKAKDNNSDKSNEDDKHMDGRGKENMGDGEDEEDVAEDISRHSRYPSAVRGCIAAMLMFVRSQHCNAFQTVMGIFLHCTGCPRRVLEALSSLGLSVSYEQVRKALGSLTKDALDQVQKAVLNNDWYVVYDNINIAIKHHHQRVDKRDAFENGTAATVILIPDAKNNEPVTVFRRIAEGSRPEADIFFPTATDVNLSRAACRAHLSAAIVRSFPHAPTACMIPMQAIDEMDVIKTVTFPLPTMKIDESTISGNLSVLESITRIGLRLPDTWFDSSRNIIVGGDQMTVARLLSLKIHRAIESDLYGGLNWVHPTPQFFHLQMTLCATIYKTHLGTDGNVPGSLASFIDRLGSKGFSKEKPEFKATNELLRIVFDAMSIVLWESLHDKDTLVESDMSRVVDLVVDAIASLSQNECSLNGRPCTTADINALCFLRDMVVYIEFSDAIKAGDRGRIRCVLATIAMMMHGGNNSNYALELLRLLYGMRHAWTPEWETRVLSSMLVNPKGVPRGWMPTDMYQENNNYLIKTIFAAKGSNMSWEYLRDLISPNIRTFQDIARLFERGVDSKYNSTVHKKPSTKSDVEMVKESLQYSGILCASNLDNRPPPALVADLLRVGATKMTEGAISRFLQKNRRYDAVDIDEVEDNEHILNE
ncbi:hypothetical protein MVEG_10419 [Podila verticillata NRRL 6337]|nr:hypothetical protein MVEG_10419 [Podila verticillata NRRL 6337]